MSTQAVIDLAVRKFKASTDPEVVIEDALIWSMEHYDTDDMPQVEYDKMLKAVERGVNGYVAKFDLNNHTLAVVLDNRRVTIQKENWNGKGNTQIDLSIDEILALAEQLKGVDA